MAAATPEKNRENVRKHYYANKEYYRDKNRQQRERKREFLRELKTDVPCTDCGVKYPHYVLEFDHIEEKDYNINAGLTWIKIKTELEKCEVVCANCHSVRTHLRRTDGSN